MQINNQLVAEKIAEYLRHDIPLAELVDWAEKSLLDADFDEQSSAELSAIVARLGVADVRAFGLTWEDCESMLRTLGYDVRVEVVPV